MNKTYDVVIVGAGVAGAMIAKQLGLAGKKVLILESGAGLPPDINDFMERFYTAFAKVPESPYTPALFDKNGLVDPTSLNAPRASVITTGQDSWQDSKKSYLIQKGPLPFASSYERIAGGTMRHWLGTSLRFLPNDFRMHDAYEQEVNWPITYDDLEPWYGRAEAEIGISANADEQAYLGITFPENYSYPMPKIPMSTVDEAIGAAVDGQVIDDSDLPARVTSTPAGRNSRPYQNRRVCAGNTNCIPICPIGAKYDPSVTLTHALDTGNVDLWPKTVATEVIIDVETGRVSQINYVQYAEPGGPQTSAGSVMAKVFVIGAHAIETPKLLLRSNKQLSKGIANESKQVGRNLMDHPIYLAWALMPESTPIYPYRGPLSTSGIESLRDGEFRRNRAAYRVEIGNEGWNFPIGDPDTTTIDFINGINHSGLNTGQKALFGKDLVNTLNSNLTRQFRLGFLVEQSPEASNYVTLSETYTDHLGLQRPEIHYDLSDYTRKGFVAAQAAAKNIFALLKAQPFTSAAQADDPKTFEADGTRFKFFGAGHIVGTYRMGSDPAKSVVDKFQRSWDHKNLFLVGSGVFPTVTTANPTLTITALALWAADTIKKDLM